MRIAEIIWLDEVVDVYGAFGQSDAGRYLVVYFILKADRSALILSARDMARKDRRRYERR